MMERFCPDCGVVLEAGHARCRPCFLRFEAAYQRYTERAWMARNYPIFGLEICSRRTAGMNKSSNLARRRWADGLGEDG